MTGIDLSGRTVLVVGALGTIGRAVADAVLAGGGEVVRADVAAASAASEETAPTGAIALDATDPDDVASAFRSLSGRVTDVVVTVGMLDTGEVRDTDRARAAAVVDVNLLAPLNVMAAGLRQLPRGGTLTVLSSQAAQHGSAGWGLYSATKSALVRLVESAAKEEGPRGIRVNAVAPGSVESPMMQRAIAEAAMRDGTTEAAVRARYEASSPQGRLVRPEEIADAVVFLISPLAQFISGQCIIVDGGEGPA